MLLFLTMFPQCSCHITYYTLCVPHELYTHVVLELCPEFTTVSSESLLHTGNMSSSFTETDQTNESKINITITLIKSVRSQIITNIVHNYVLH